MKPLTRHPESITSTRAAGRKSGKGAARFLLPEDRVAYQAIINAPFGSVGIQTAIDTVFDQPVVYEIRYLPAHTGLNKHTTRLPSDSASAHFIQQVIDQLHAYFDHPQFHFELPLAPRGTAFQQRLREHMLSIPCGQTQTYGEVAKQLKSGPRAVGQACGANLFPLLIPCHRVISACGIGGFARADDGFYIGIKRWLLAHEGVHFE
jgi:methylated-DNA-[protein]-cysteine S-methyltransferase